MLSGEWGSLGPRSGLPPPVLGGALRSPGTTDLFPNDCSVDIHMSYIHIHNTSVQPHPKRFSSPHTFSLDLCTLGWLLRSFPGLFLPLLANPLASQESGHLSRHEISCAAIQNPSQAPQGPKDKASVPQASGDFRTSLHHSPFGPCSSRTCFLQSLNSTLLLQASHRLFPPPRTLVPAILAWLTPTREAPEPRAGTQEQTVSAHGCIVCVCAQAHLCKLHLPSYPCPDALLHQPCSICLFTVLPFCLVTEYSAWHKGGT